MTTRRILRGGAWSHLFVRCASHLATDAVRCDGFYGFRPVAKAIPADSARVARGCCWFSIAQTVRCAIPLPAAPTARYPFLGLRPVAKAKP